MAARVNKIRHDEETRSKIKAAQLINRLTDFVDGKITLVPAQVTAALGLLKKVIPDTQSVEISGEVETTYVARIPEAKPDAISWHDKHVPEQHRGH